MKQILNVESKDYNIIISDEDFDSFINEIILYTSHQKRLFVISKKVYNLYKDILKLNSYDYLIIDDSEKSKNYKTYLNVLKKASEIGLTRSDVIISIGGGVTGDIAGFAASTYMRGIDIIQVPTTLLSMVDSSVGGKTGINMFNVKNIIGTFYQPKRVFININFLKTLDKRQFLSGIGEILKYSFIEHNCKYKHSLFLFEYLTLSYQKVIEQEPVTLMRIIAHCLNLKISIVNQDEKETNLRRVLNFGHTYGHAIESLGGFNKKSHGEAIVQGMFLMFNYAYAENLITYSYYYHAIDLLSKYGFKFEKKNYNPNKILKIMKKDKKASSNKIVFIVPCDKKKVKEIKLDDDEVLNLLKI